MIIKAVKRRRAASDMSDLGELSDQLVDFLDTAPLAGAHFLGLTAEDLIAEEREGGGDGAVVLPFGVQRRLGPAFTPGGGGARGADAFEVAGGEGVGEARIGMPLLPAHGEIDATLHSRRRRRGRRRRWWRWRIGTAPRCSGAAARAALLQRPRVLAAAGDTAPPEHRRATGVVPRSADGAHQRAASGCAAG